MKHRNYIIVLCLLFALIWRAELTANVRYNFENALTWSAVLAIASFVAMFVNPWAGAFLVLAAVSAYFPFNTIWSEEAFRFIFFGVIWYAVCTFYITRVSVLYNMLCLICLYHIAVTVCQYFGFNYFESLAVPPRFASSVFERIPKIGIFDSYNSSAAFIAFCFPAFLRGWTSIKSPYIWLRRDEVSGWWIPEPIIKWAELSFRWYYFIPFILLGLIMAHTFAGLLAITGAFTVFILINGTAKQKCLYCVVSISALVAFVYLVDAPDITWRWNTWKFAITKAYPQHWVFGYGLGHWYWIFARTDVVAQTLFLVPKDIQIMDPAHNEFVQGLFEMGIGFAIIVLGYIIDIVKRFRKEAVLPLSAFASIVIVSLVFFPFHIGLLALVALTWMAILEKSLRSRHRSKLFVRYLSQLSLVH